MPRYTQIFVENDGASVWESKEIPWSWQCALVVLISKSEVLDTPSEFRPIALLNAEGRLDFTLMQ